MEENKKAKKPKHKLANRHPFIASVLFSLVAFFAIQFPPIVAGSVAGNTDIGMIAAAAFSFIAMAVYKFRFRPDFEGMLRGGRPLLGFWLLSLFLVVWALHIVGTLALGEDGLIPPLTGFCIALMAGFCEETAFRGIGLSILLRGMRSEKRILHALLFTSAVFAVVHAANAAAGADISMTAVQVAAAFCMALLLGASYIRSGNILPAIICHVLNDVVAFMGNPDTASSGIYTESATWTSLVGLSLYAVMGVIGLWLVSPEKRAEIRALWAMKWNEQSEANSCDEVL